MMTLLRAVIRRDLLLAWRRRADIATVVLFFVIVVSLFPLGVGPEPNLLRTIAPGIIWVAALLACMLSLQNKCSLPTTVTAHSTRCCWRRPRWA